MKYQVIGDMLPAVAITLDRDESIVTESGGMSWMSGNIRMESNVKGGFMGGLTRAFSGESVFLNTYTAQGGEGLVACSSSMPGRILVFDLQAGQSIIAQKGSFLCASQGVSLSVAFRKSLGAGMFGGEGFIMQKIEGPGLVFLEIDGHVEKYTLKPGEVMKVDPGHVAIHTPDVAFSVELMKGFKNMLFGGEGLFLTTLTGPGDIWLQSMTASNLATRLLPYIPAKN